jgi:hypothetical protein
MEIMEKLRDSIELYDKEEAKKYLAINVDENYCSDILYILVSNILTPHFEQIPFL